MSLNLSHIQYELLLPNQLRAIIAKRPVAYIPLGTYEWHGEHLPVGLDALTSHGICLRSAAQDGGVVLPPLHYGTGGGHGDYPWTVIMSTPIEIESQLDFTIAKLKTFGFKMIIIFSGHFPPEQLGMIDRLAQKWATDHFQVFATAVNRIEGLGIGPDHAGLFETTLLAAMWPELVQLENLPSIDEAPIPDDEDNFGIVRHDSMHPIWGVFGPDPRLLKISDAPLLLEKAVTWLVGQVRNRIDKLG